MYFLTHLLFANIPLLLYYVNLNSSIICCLFSGDVYIFLWVFLIHPNFVNVIPLKIVLKHLLFYWQFYYQLNHQLFLLLFKLLHRVVEFLALSRSFWLYSLIKFLATLVACVPMVLAKDKNPYPFTYALYPGSTE